MPDHEKCNGKVVEGKRGDDMIALHLTHHGYVKSDRLKKLPLVEYKALSVIGMIIAAFLGGWYSVAPGFLILKIVCLCSILLIVGCRVLRWNETGRNRIRNGEISESKITGTRLACFGEAQELLPLKEIRARFFEPVIVRGSHRAIIKTTNLSRLWHGFVSILYVGSYWVAWKFLPVPFAAKLLIFIVFGMLAVLMYDIVSRAYYRISPGKIEILKCNLFFGNLSCLKELDLGEASIICNFSLQRLIIIEPNEENCRSCQINLSRLDQPHRFVEAVFAAALTPDPNIAIPSDQLLG